MEISWQNPIIPGFHPDPSICRVGSDYYLTVSSFEYFPGLPLFHSRDLVHWRLIGHAMTRPSQLVLDNAWTSGGLYAPSIRHHNGKFYIACTNTSHKGNFVISADKADGPWSEPIYIPQEGIDPDLFWDTDGKLYLTTSAHHKDKVRLLQSELDPVTFQPKSAPYTLWEGAGGSGTEGPHIYLINGTYYLMAAEGGTEYGHTEVIARGPHPKGPWESCPRNPILTHRSTNSPIQGTGHGDLVQTDKGHWFMVHLGFRTTGYHSVHLLGRETFLTPVVWNSDGWPSVGSNNRTGLAFASANLPPPHPCPVEATRDNFDAEKLAPTWAHIRAPVAHRYDLQTRPGWLTLTPCEQDLDNMFYPTWVGRRQQHFDFQATTCLEYRPERELEQAGLCVWQNYLHHYSITLTCLNGRRRVVVRRRIGTLSAITGSVEVGAEMEKKASNRVYLRITGNAGWYRLSCAFGEEGPWIDLDTAETRYLSTEVGGRFTGVLLGLFTSAPRGENGPKAAFDWFDYLPL